MCTAYISRLKMFPNPSLRNSKRCSAFTLFCFEIGVRHYPSLSAGEGDTCLFRQDSLFQTSNKGFKEVRAKLVFLRVQNLLRG